MPHTLVHVKGCLKRKLTLSFNRVKRATTSRYTQYRFKPDDISDSTRGETMKRLVTLAACLAMLTFTGCANGILCQGLFGGGNSGCNSSPGLFGSNGLFSNGPLQQFSRGDACDSCNSAAGQVAPSFSAPTCDACGGVAPASQFAIPTDPYAIPQGSFPTAQPATSFYPSNSGVSLEQPVLQGSGINSIDPGAIYSGSGSVNGGLADPPFGIN